MCSLFYEKLSNIYENFFQQNERIYIWSFLCVVQKFYCIYKTFLKKVSFLMTFFLKEKLKAKKNLKGKKKWDLCSFGPKMLIFWSETTHFWEDDNLKIVNSNPKILFTIFKLKGKPIGTLKGKIHQPRGTPWWNSVFLSFYFFVLGPH